MFTINIYLRFALIALCLIGGVLLSVFVSFWYALPVLLIGIALLVGYILLGTIQSAAPMLQSQDFAGAAQRLNLTWKPEWLYSSNRAMYYMLKGTIAQQRKDNVAAEAYLKQAAEIDLPTDNEKAMITLQLANIAAQRGKWKEAKLLHRDLKDLKVTEPMIKEQMKMFDQAMKQQGQMRHMGVSGGGQRGGVQRGGGKRRRPKLR